MVDAYLMQRFALAVFFEFVIVTTGLSFQENMLVPTGPGSYTTVRPEPCKPLPETIYKVDSLKGPTPTNQWWSSLVWQKYSSNMFPHPLGVVACENGLSVSYPGAAIVGSDNAIMGGGVSPNGDIVIGMVGDKPFRDARLESFSDWFITTRFESAGSGILKTSFGHGSPFVFCEFVSGKPRFQFFEKPVLWAGDLDSEVVGITVRGNHYGLFCAAGSRWKIVDEKTVTLDSDKDFFSIALLPDNDPETLKSFARRAHNHVTNTSFSFEIENGRLQTTWRLETEQKQQSSFNDTITALYPHQWKYSKSKISNKTYRSVRGEMKVLIGNSFQTSVPIQGVLPMLPAAEIPDRERVIGYLDAELDKPPSPFGDSYWEGKYLGKLATLSGICEALGEMNRQQQVVNLIKQRLENWFTASANESSPLFYYNSTWGTLIGSRPSYGSDVELNDHHFHYGYFIRAAAEVARIDKAWAQKWAPMVELLIRDIASSKSDDSLFPRMRCFDLYAGHSWASGHARFGDGNNQESSSESMNAWYGMMLWGKAVDNQELLDLGMFLFNTERIAVEEYWFDVSGTNFPKEFSNVAVGMVWGGKGAFATWFSGDIDHIHGINWLPMTPASLYMGRHPEYVKSNHDRVVAKRKAGSNYNEGWGDLVAMFGALAEPKRAVDHIDSNPNCNIEGGNSHAFMYQWIHTLDRLGLNSTRITADDPFATVFLKDGQKTYVAYHFGNESKTITFSDGKRMVMEKRGLHLQPLP